MSSLIPVKFTLSGVTSLLILEHIYSLMLKVLLLLLQFQLMADLSAT